MMFPEGTEALRLWLHLASDMQERYGLPLLGVLPHLPQLMIRSIEEVRCPTVLSDLDLTYECVSHNMTLLLDLDASDESETRSSAQW